MGGIGAFLVVLLPILVSIKIAKDRRKSCAWGRDEANSQIIGAGLMILLSQFFVFYTRAEPLSIVGGALTLALWYGVYRLARAIYRTRDLKKEVASF
jgi:hypothetical protein